MRRRLHGAAYRTGGALALLALACGRSDVRRAAQQPRNLLIVVLDTLRPDHLGCYGYARPTSPHLDALARECVVFEDAQTVSPWTAPSLISLMTSLHPEVHQVIDSPNPGRLNESVVTLAETLKSRGYATAAFTEGGYAKGQFGLDQGFDLYPSNPGDTETDHSITGQPSRIRENVDRTLSWLRERRGEAFFLFFHTYEIHAPYRATEESIRLVRPEHDEAADRERARRIIEDWNRDRRITPEGYEFLSSRMLLSSNRPSFRGLPAIEHAQDLTQYGQDLGLGSTALFSSPAVTGLVRDLYDGCIRSADQELERLWQELRDLGMADDTLLVIVSDHGEGLGRRGEMEHGNVLAEEAMRIVLMIRAPRCGAVPRRVRGVVSLLDVVPTVLELLATDATRVPRQGASLVPVLRGSAPAGRFALGHGRTMDRSRDSLYTVRTDSWRLLRDLESGATQLFDRAADPNEETDVAAAHPDVVARLGRLLERQRERDLAVRKALAADVQHLPLDDATLRELRGLGYVGGDGR